MPLIDKKTLNYLAELARIDLKPEEETKLLHDLEEILEYFNQLREVDTQGIEPLTGGTTEKNVFREDEDETREVINSSPDELISAFPKKEGKFLKVPPVFE